MVKTLDDSAFPGGLVTTVEIKKKCPAVEKYILSYCRTAKEIKKKCPAVEI